MQHAVVEQHMLPQRILETVERAISGQYKPRGGWNQRELDVSFLAKVASGQRFLGLLNRVDGYAAATTICNNFNIPHLKVRLSKPTALEISENIHAFFNAELLRPPQPLGLFQNRRHLGVALLWDGIAIEQHCQ